MGVGGIEIDSARITIVSQCGAIGVVPRDSWVITLEIFHIVLFVCHIYNHQVKFIVGDIYGCSCGILV